MPLMTSPADFTLLITDRNLNVIGDPIGAKRAGSSGPGWTNIGVLPRFNEPASASFTASREAVSSGQLLAMRSGGCRVVVIRDGEFYAGGRVEKPGRERWSVDGADSGAGTIEVRFSDDLAWVLGRRTYPDPTVGATAQTSTARWTSTGNAEDIMRSLVDLNAGPGALVARRMPKLILGPDQGVGSTITFGTRFEPLGDALRRVAIAGGGLGFRTRQVGTNIEFQVYQPQDLSSVVRFSRGLGNLREYDYDPEAPRATTAIVGGKDEGTSRVIVERTDAALEAAWDRIEAFVDQRQSDATAVATAELDQAGDEELTRNGETARLAAVTIDTPDQRYGVDYQLGDRVSIELNSGVVVEDVVRAVQLQVTPERGEVVTALIGSQEASSDPAWLKYMHDLGRRLAGLETI